MLRGVLRQAIRFYRRRLSGRGLFAQVRCTFSGLESCSAYAERIVAETPSTLLAIRRILRRLARCRSLSLYRLTGGRLGWGSDYDAVLTAVSPQQAAFRLESLLAEDGEGVAVRAAVRGAAALVAVAATVAPRKPLPENAAPLPALRDGLPLRRAFRRRFRGRCLLAGAAAASAAVAAVGHFGTLPVLCCLLVAGVGLLRARAARAVLQRLEWLEILASIEGPDGAEATASSNP